MDWFITLQLKTYLATAVIMLIVCSPAIIGSIGKLRMDKDTKKKEK
jgi:hypothetical protein